MLCKFIIFYKLTFMYFCFLRWLLKYYKTFWEINFKLINVHTIIICPLIFLCNKNFNLHIQKDKLCLCNLYFFLICSLTNHPSNQSKHFLYSWSKVLKHPQCASIWIIKCYQRKFWKLDDIYLISFSPIWIQMHFLKYNFNIVIHYTQTEAKYWNIHKNWDKK